MADLERSSKFEYTYLSDTSLGYSENLDTGDLHNLNAEIGIDFVMPNSLSLFLIYERNQALESGYTDNLHLAIGYLPNKKTNFALSIDGSDDFKSNYLISKNINNYNIDLKLSNSLMRPEKYDEIYFNLSHQF